MTPWTVAHQAPLPTGFSRQEHWSGLPCPPSEDLPDPGTEPGSLALQADSLPSEPQEELHKDHTSNISTGLHKYIPFSTVFETILLSKHKR